MTSGGFSATLGEQKAKLLTPLIYAFSRRTSFGNRARAGAQVSRGAITCSAHDTRGGGDWDCVR
ncbi:hypothetical protein SBA5_120032 [Candidatus Sulfotelmatomonas gaucii]|uniref:Uncharacterized protein n=1 Tax=Candidatus Sulfuritelmatomonas gaucii TaxID=2043161 RepID=A0A2N9L3S6_9BACT|nr:hypothetical protein SBA5_120032 [Candidatus Sulfotelmatomonas gaucii]